MDYMIKNFENRFDVSLKNLIQESGLEYIAAYDAFTKNAPTDVSERIYVIAREQGK